MESWNGYLDALKTQTTYKPKRIPGRRGYCLLVGYGGAFDFTGR